MANVVVELTGDEAKLLRAMQRVLEQQAKMSDGFKNVGKNSNVLELSLNKSLSSLKTMATSALAVDTAFQAIGTAQKSFIERMEKSIDLVRELAAAQQEAAKNLAGNSQTTISDVLLSQVPSIAKSATFSDLGKITTALGSVSSIVGEDKAASIVEAAANVTRFKKDDLQTTATATADVVKAAGLKDGREAMSLLLSSGAVARPEELPKLAMAASKAIYAGVNASPTQNPVEAAKEASALVAMMSKVDKNGESAATAAVQLEELMRETFKPTRDEEAKRSEQIKELLQKQAVTQEESLRIERARLTVQAREEDVKRFRDTDQSPKAALARLSVEEARSNLIEAQKDAGLTPKEAEELRRLQIQASYSGKDPGTFRSRLETVRNDPELMRTVEANLKGEAQFRPIMQGLLDANSVHSKELDAAIATVTTDITKFDDAMKSMLTTPQQAVALASEKIDTETAVKQFKDVNMQMMSAIDESVKKALKENPLTGFEAFKENTLSRIGSIATLGQIDFSSPVSMTSSPEEALRAGIGSLQTRQMQIRGIRSNESLSEEEKAKIRSLDVSIQALQTMSKQVEAVRPQETATKKADTPPAAAPKEPTIEEIARQSVSSTRRAGFIGMKDDLAYMVQDSQFASEIKKDPDQKANWAVGWIRDRMSRLEGSSDPNKDKFIEQLKADEERIWKMNAESKKQGGQSDVAQAIEKQNSMMAEQLDVLKKIAEKSGPRPEARSQALREQIAGAN